MAGQANVDVFRRRRRRRLMFVVSNSFSRETRTVSRQTRTLWVGERVGGWVSASRKYDVTRLDFWSSVGSMVPDVRAASCQFVVESVVVALSLVVSVVSVGRSVGRLVGQLLLLLLLSSSSSECRSCCVVRVDRSASRHRFRRHRFSSSSSCCRVVVGHFELGSSSLLLLEIWSWSWSRCSSAGGRGVTVRAFAQCCFRVSVSELCRWCVYVSVELHL